MLALAMEFSRSTPRTRAKKPFGGFSVRRSVARELAPSGPDSVPGRRPAAFASRSTPDRSGVLDEVILAIFRPNNQWIDWSSRRVVTVHR
jgi:hypothetical protein